MHHQLIERLRNRRKFSFINFASTTSISLHHHLQPFSKPPLDTKKFALPKICTFDYNFINSHIKLWMPLYSIIYSRKKCIISHFSLSSTSRKNLFGANLTFRIIFGEIFAIIKNVSKKIHENWNNERIFFLSLSHSLTLYNKI